MDEQSALDAFGEEEPELIGSNVRRGVQDDCEWLVQSQQSLQFGGDLCTLTCLESPDKEQLRFEILKKNRDTLTVRCTRQQFQQVWDEQKDTSGPARANAAICQMFKEGLEEWPEAGILAPVPEEPREEDGDKSVDGFGEDDTDTAVDAVHGGPHTAGQDPDKWYLESQQSWELGGELCTLTCLESGDGKQLRFEVLKHNRDTITVTCGRQQFQALCDEQQQPTGPARASAAIRQLFKEGLDEWPESSLTATKVGPEMAGKLKEALRSWSRCSGGSVAPKDMKALLLRLKLHCTDGAMEKLLAPCLTPGGRVSVDSLIDSIMPGHH